MSVIIIGAGVAGLSCGCYLRMNGYETLILEANAVPGGLCVGWDRGPYVFDGCLRWLVGTHSSSDFHRIWSELGVLSGSKVQDHHEFLRVEARDGRVLSFTADLDRLERDLKQISPDDSPRIAHLLKSARRCSPLEPPEKPLDLMNPFEKTRLLLRYFPMLSTFVWWKRRELGSYLAGYQDSFLREAFMAVGGEERMAALTLMMVLGLRSRRSTGYLVGGSRALARAVADRYTRLGGGIRYNSEVTSVEVENGRVTGVRCADGAIVPATTVVSCADGHATLFKMLGGQYLEKQLSYAYAQCDVFQGVFQVALGVNRTFPTMPRALSFPLSRTLVVDAASRHDRLEVVFYDSESGLCPEGKSILSTRFTGSFDHWSALRQTAPNTYSQAKQELLEEVIRFLNERFPGLSDHIECKDLATPATFARFTGNWQGSIQGWLPTPRILGRRFPRTLPGLKDFYMAGHWIEPGGGLPMVAISGKFAAQMICARDGRTFQSTAA